MRTGRDTMPSLDKPLNLGPSRLIRVEYENCQILSNIILSHLQIELLQKHRYNISLKNNTY